MVSVLLVVVWIGSGWFVGAWSRPFGLTAILFRGQILVQWSSDTPVTPWFGKFTAAYYPSAIRPWFDWKSTPGDWSLATPTWLPASISLLITATAWRLDTLACRRANKHLCPKCNYTLTGLPPNSPCPECGTPPFPAPSHS